ISTPGSTAPLGSFTVPFIWAVACAQTMELNTRVPNSAMQNPPKTRFIVPPHPSSMTKAGGSLAVPAGQSIDVGPVGAVYDRAYFVDSRKPRGHRPRLQRIHGCFSLNLRILSAALLGSSVKNSMRRGYL